MPIYHGNKLVSDINVMSDGFVGFNRVFGEGPSRTLASGAINPSTLSPNIWFDANQAAITTGGTGGITGVSNQGSDFATFNTWPSDNPSFTLSPINVSGSVKFGRFGDNTGANNIYSCFNSTGTSYLKTIISIARKYSDTGGLAPEGSFWSHCAGDNTEIGIQHTWGGEDSGVSNNQTCQLGIGGVGGGHRLNAGFANYVNETVTPNQPFTFFTARSNDWREVFEDKGDKIYDVEMGYGYQKYANPIDTLYPQGGAWPTTPNSIGFPYGEDLLNPTIGGGFDIAVILGFNYVLTRQQITGIYAFYADLGYDLV